VQRPYQRRRRSPSSPVHGSPSPIDVSGPGFAAPVDVGAPARTGVGRAPGATTSSVTRVPCPGAGSRTTLADHSPLNPRRTL
jgi:hypothetical protein